MRLFLLPISTRRTLIYCQRLNVTTKEQKGWLDKGTTKAAEIWANWEKKDSGWQKNVVHYGNGALKRIPYEEWGLKSIPPLSARRKQDELSGKEEVEVEYPPTLIPEAIVKEVLRKLATERQGLHQSRFIWSLAGTIATIPIGILPIIPNLPCYYLIFRAWSHWRALKGSRHIEFLLHKQMITTKPSKILDELYSTGKHPFAVGTAAASTTKTSFSGPDTSAEKMVLHISNGKRIAEALNIPELNTELDRAVWQVERALKAALKAEQELKEEKDELDAANAQSKEKK